MFDGSGNPSTGPQIVAAMGNMTRTWVIWLQGLNALVAISDVTLNTIGPTKLTVMAPVQDGVVMAQIIRQKSAGCLITWDPAVFQNAPTNIDTTAGTESLFLFLGYNGYWLYLLNWTGQPLSATP